jgi:hypothetical protein
MRTYTCVFIIVAIVVSGCARQSSQTDARAVTAEAQSVLNSMSDSLRTQGLMGWIPFLHNSPEFSWEFNGASSSYDSLIAGERAQASLYRSVILTWDSVNAEPAGENGMRVTAKFSEVLVRTDGREATIRGWVDCQLRRTDGTWKFTRGKTFDR